MKQLLIAVVALIVIAAVAFGIHTVGARNKTNAVSAKDASKLVGGGTGGSSIEAGLRPMAGTYSYAGSGSESISALGGSTHQFPSTVAQVVTLDATDTCAWTDNLVYVKQHIEQRKYCTTGTGVVDRGFERRIEFFNQLDTKTYTCGADAQRVVAGAAVGSKTMWVCKQGTKAISSYVATYKGPEQLTIGGAQVDVAHVLVTSKQTGDTRGNDTQNIWYLPSGLPAKFVGKLKVTTASVLGDTQFQEQYSYTLTSVSPVANAPAA